MPMPPDGRAGPPGAAGPPPPRPEGTRRSPNGTSARATGAASRTVRPGSGRSGSSRAGTGSQREPGTRAGLDGLDDLAVLPGRGGAGALNGSSGPNGADHPGGADAAGRSRGADSADGADRSRDAGGPGSAGAGTGTGTAPGGKAGPGSGADPGGEAVGPPAEPVADAGELERVLAELLAFLRRRITGDYTVDEHGFDPDLTEHIVAPLLRPIYRSYFRVETRGLENIPDKGGALVVSNHSGTVPLDALMTALAILDHHPAHRHLRMLAADLVFALPFLAPLARKTGNTLACQADAERLLGAGHLVGVWPEGFKGIGKPFSDRYKLQRFGRGGFVSAALRTGVPIVPCTVVGAEEIYPMVGNARTLARLLGLPYLPITPTFPWLGLLGLVPLPSKWIIEFGEPVDTTEYTQAAAEDPMLVFELTDRIRETIQHTLYGLLMQRRSVFF
ncbi:lysophospholipid acyltransferase family protein [Parafrankia sp. Ea1.12]|uniref:lysophospholipid acyltransferase family protein n=1 Tax=Parafrankia sp. Ea1.12 TaxID=573499 RepID=UPI0034CEB5BD